MLKNPILQPDTEKNMNKFVLVKICHLFLHDAKLPFKLGLKHDEIFLLMLSKSFYPNF